MSSNIAAPAHQTAFQTPGGSYAPSLAKFWEIEPDRRLELLQRAIQDAHAWHYPRNPAYRAAVSGRGVGPVVEPADFPRLLRPTAQTFKSYIDLLGTPFPQDAPLPFVKWLAEQFSVEIPTSRQAGFRPRYRSLEALLQDFERIYADFGFEISTSSGTSGRATIMVRDQESIGLTVESFYLCFQRYFGMQVDHRAIFIMPGQTRIAMARMVSFCLPRIGIPPERCHFTIPFPAYPDQVRVRAGRTYRPGWEGQIEKRLMNPFIHWMSERYVAPRAIGQTLRLLQQAQEQGDKVLLFASWIHLHAIALALLSKKQALRLAPGSLLGTGGGFKELYPHPPAQIQSDLAQAIQIADGSAAPLRDVYGMAEGNWAAMQCQHGSYHLPPWIFAAALDENDRFTQSSDATGLLAFFDPFAGGSLFPAFFKTSDQVRLINASGFYNPSLDCPCGEVGAYITPDSIRRVDLLDEAGCAAQI
jgi:hypothetical protein